MKKNSKSINRKDNKLIFLNKSQKGITLLMLTITIVVLVIIISITANVSMNLIVESQFQDLKTNMLLVQAKAKVFSEEVSFQTANLSIEKQEDATKISEIQNNELVGIKLSECSEEIKNKATNAGITEFDKYYCLNESDLETMGIKIELAENEYYLVKYDLQDTEIVYTKGFNYHKNTYYKLSELNAISK